MKSPSTIPLAALAAAALITLSGCGLLGGQDGGDSGSGAGGDPVNGGKVDPGSAEERKTLASQDVTALGTDMHFAIHELARRGETVELTFSVTNTGDQDSDGMSFWLNKDETSPDVGGVKLVDPKNAKLHLVARGPGDDEKLQCVCSVYGTSDNIPAKGTVFFSATFGAPPEDVETMNVRMPLAGSFNDVPVS